MKKGKRGQENVVDAGLYLRVSSREQAEEGYSLEAQETTLRQYCKVMGWHVQSIYKDEGISGKSMRRPGLTSMLDDVKNGWVNKIVTLKLDRLSRNSKDLLVLTDDLEKKGVSICYIKDQIDTSTAAGKMLRTIMAALAQFESDVAKERTLSVKEEMARQGKFVGGNIPYGYEYDRDEREFVINEAEAAVVERVFSEYLAGATTYRIAQQLNKEEIPTKRRGRWQAVQVEYILANVFYSGQLQWEGIISKGTHQAIISERQFNKVQRRLHAAPAGGQRASSAL